ncbi:GFA family protein [Novosphingobium sp. 1949]|uniref:GFA family protein n=1 Tax=Novosphingobium organovorum TaxID=2930092 RepID=A0ABT0BA25_9SPHN|nr:GFA family protein [Novosphingobium organovorum]MCJ2181873.1 GFA family protein [Novosphingobium organovorum]
MTTPYHGRCTCGAVSLTIAAEPLWVRQCWCRQCQKAASGNATVNALFTTAAMTITGTPGWKGYRAASGNTIEHGFCADCGTPLFGRNSSRPDSWVVRLGVLDAGHALAPTGAIWTEEAPAWAMIDPALENWPRQPPPPAKVD